MIDVQDQPRVAEDAGIYITPTLIREYPDSAVRVVGNLAEAAKCFEPAVYRQSGSKIIPTSPFSFALLPDTP
ncbi:MAG: hypothetical protein FJY97_12090 [candidate division Zixibacteria bacterium]|nr:hypothetical protein [candidate division Zixibacteria bacterium]